MRLSTLTIVVFVAHTSTLAIAAPIPFTDDVRELVARGDDEPPAASSGTSGSEWRRAASRVANLPLRPSTKRLALAVSTAQMAFKVGLNSGPPQPSPPFPLPIPPGMHPVPGMPPGHIPPRPSLKLPPQPSPHIPHSNPSPQESLKKQLKELRPVQAPTPIRPAPSPTPLVVSRPRRKKQAKAPARKQFIRKFTPARKRVRKVPQGRGSAKAAKAKKAPRKRDLEIDELD